MPSSQLLNQGVWRLFLGVATATLLVAILAVGRDVFVPLALAAMLAFVLNTPVAALEGKGVPRVPSVAVVLMVALTLPLAFGYALTRQFSDFAEQMPRYSTSIKSKLATLHETRNGAIGTIQNTVQKLTNELDKQEKTARVPGAAPDTPPAQPVSIVPPQPNDVQRLQTFLEPVIRPIATGGVVVILTAFMLVRREDLRNRLIRIVGRGRVTVTTRTLDEAGHRISIFLFTQSLINACFGLCAAAGLIAIGVPYALLWGVSAAFLRFVPYLGALLAVIMPAALAFVESPGWGPTIETIVLFVGLDALTANLVEPILIGAHTGVSSLALLVSTMFWTWLWGPVGLILSTPFTVCLVTIGRHVSWLEFLAVLLGDETPLEAEVTLYQRLLASDEDEAVGILDQEIEKADRTTVFDRVVLPTVMLANLDKLHDDISDTEYRFVIQTLRDILHHRSVEPDRQDPSSSGSSQPPRRILGVPARNDADELALELFTGVLDVGWTIESLTTAALVSEVVAAIEQRRPDILCISALPPGGFTHIRYLCKRVHIQYPELPILVLRLGIGEHAAKTVEELTKDGARSVATTFAMATTQLKQVIFPASNRHSTEVAAPKPVAVAG